MLFLVISEGLEVNSIKFANIRDKIWRRSLKKHKITSFGSNKAQISDLQVFVGSSRMTDIYIYI